MLDGRVYCLEVDRLQLTLLNVLCKEFPGEDIMERHNHSSELRGWPVANKPFPGRAKHLLGDKEIDL